MSLPTLYAIGEDLEAVYRTLEENGGDLTPELEKALFSLEGMFEEKAERVALMIRQMQAHAETVGIEERRLASRRKALENGANGLREYLRHWLERFEKMELRRPLVTIRIQQSPPAAKCTVPAIPPDFVRVIPERYEFDATKAIEMWRSGQPLPAGVEVTRGTHLRIT